MNRRHAQALDALLIVSAWVLILAAIMYYPAKADVQAFVAQEETGGTR